MPRVNPVNGTLVNMHSAGAIILANGVPCIRVVVVGESGEDETVNTPLIEFKGITQGVLDKLVTSVDKTHAAKIKYRKDSENALKMGFLDIKVFNAMFGKGEGEKVLATLAESAGETQKATLAESAGKTQKAA